MKEFLTHSNRWLKLTLFLPGLVLNAWMIIRLFQYFEPFVTILVVAGILAFVLNYPVEFLQKRHFDRNYAVLLVVLLSIIGLGTLAVTLLPVLLQQLSGIVEQFPDWLSTVDQKLHAF